MIKKIVSVILAICIVFLCSLGALAISVEQPQTFIDENGREITYFIDEENIPFILIDGEKIYIALALQEYEVTDTSVVSELNEQKNYDENVESRSVPNNFYDLSGCDNNSNSITYSVSASGLGSSYYNTRVLKYNRSHSALVIKTSSHKPLLCDEKVNIIYYYYYEEKDKWYSYIFMNKDCSTLGGFRFLHSPSAYEYGKVGIIAHSTLESCNLEIYTTPYATGDSSSIPDVT